MKSRKTVWVFMVSLALLLATAAEGAIIVSRPGDPVEGIPWDLNGEQSLAVSWTQAALLNNVAINVFNLQNYSTGSEMQILFGLAVGDVSNAPIYNAVYTVGADATVADAALDFGTTLNLPAGTWFLTATGAGTGAWWSGDTGAQQELLGTFGPEYFNTGGGWQELEGLTLGYQATGDADGAVIPEPGTWALIGGGLLLMSGLLRRRRS